MSAINGCRTPSEWFCLHCGEWFSTVARTCSCGAQVVEAEGVAVMPDRHEWSNDGFGGCVKCKVLA